MTHADIYRGAASLIRTQGWVRGQFMGPGGRRCAYAAICEAAPDFEDAYAAIVHLAQELTGRSYSRSDVGPPVRAVATWNDSCETGDEVVLRLEYEASRCDGSGDSGAIGKHHEAVKEPCLV